MLFAAVHESGCGTKLPFTAIKTTSACWGTAVVWSRLGSELLRLSWLNGRIQMRKTTLFAFAWAGLARQCACFPPR